MLQAPNVAIEHRDELHRRPCDDRGRSPTAREDCDLAKEVAGSKRLSHDSALKDVGGPRRDRKHGVAEVPFLQKRGSLLDLELIAHRGYAVALVDCELGEQGDRRDSVWIHRSDATTGVPTLGVRVVAI